MIETDKLVKIFDADNNPIGKGHLLNLSTGTIKVKGENLPAISSRTNIFIEIYSEFTGIDRYFCQVRLASYNQLNASIIKKDTVIERRKSLKVRTDLSFYIDSLHRNGEDITNEFPNMRINILNLSIGGMLISTNYELYINDVITFSFQYEKLVVLLKANVIRIDKINDNLSSFKNYGCAFEKMPSYCEDIITKYLYIRQLQLYKDK